MKKKLLAVITALTATFVLTTSAESNPIEAKVTAELNMEIHDNISTPLSEEEVVAARYMAFTENNEDMPTLKTFSDGISGYDKLVEEGDVKKELLTLVDFSLPSTKKRLWVLDMKNNEVLYHTYVSHGRNTGGNMAESFSNLEGSFQSSLGFYLTAETYYGKNGLSLFLDGKEEGFNSNARSRYVVMHGADYANPDFITRAGRLGRSLGCPAVPTELAKDIIGTIKGQSVLFTYHSDEDYQNNSTYLNASQS